MLFSTIALLIPLPPLAACAVILLLTRRRRALSTVVAVGMLALSIAGSFILVAGLPTGMDSAEQPVAQSIAWIPGIAGAADGAGAIRLGVSVDGLTELMLIFVAVTLPAIFIYSIGYHRFGSPEGPQDVPGEPPRGMEIRGPERPRRIPTVEPLYTRFFAFLSLFAFGMLLLVLAGDLASFFIGWEVMGLCSYLLIGFWFARESARRAAVKAFLVTRVGDVLMLIGFALCWRFSGSLSLGEILGAENLARMAAEPSGIPCLSAAGLAALLLLAGTVGKSAQWPLHVWLPDAMEGPTPVSALIHAATMVSAGVYLLLRIAPLMDAGGTIPSGAAVFLGAFTALLAAAIALTQSDLKRTLAYSTISQLGYMVAAAGIGATAAAAFHLAVHAFFKALLFLGAGSIAHGLEHGAMGEGEHADPQDMRAMGGLARRMPLTFAAFLAGALSLAGFPLLTAGFWSKDGILSAAQHASPVLFLALAAAALLTACYVGRILALVFLGTPRGPAARNAAEPSRWMLAPALVLAVPAVAAGWAGIPEDFPLLGGLVPDGITGLLGAEGGSFHGAALAVSILAPSAGLFLGWMAYRGYAAGRKDPLQTLLGPAFGFLQAGCRFDDLYQILFVRPARWIADVAVSEWIDRRILDGMLRAAWKGALSLGRLLRDAVDLPVINGATDRIGRGTRRAGSMLRVVQSGRVQEYLMIGLTVFVAAAAMLIWSMLAGP